MSSFRQKRQGPLQDRHHPRNALRAEHSRKEIDEEPTEDAEAEVDEGQDAEGGELRSRGFDVQRACQGCI